MRQIIIAQEKFKLYGKLSEMCEAAGYVPQWQEVFWKRLLEAPEVYKEFLYYAERQDFLCCCSINGYCITDIFVWQMRKYNVRTDRGKNGSDCDKLAMLLESFSTMLDLLEKGAKIEWGMEMKNGMDQW
ncbi:MAG: hypothetical protein QM697_18745 [Lachnospiraceae bacterium]